MAGRRRPKNIIYVYLRLIVTYQPPNETHPEFAIVWGHDCLALMAVVTTMFGSYGTYVTTLSGHIALD